MFPNFRLLIQKKQYTPATKWATKPYYHKVMQCSFPAHLNFSASCNVSLQMQVKNAKNPELKHLKTPSTSKCGSKDSKGISGSHLMVYNYLALTA